MGRHENEDLSHLDLPDPHQVDTLYYLENQAVLNDDEFNELLNVCAQEQRMAPVVCAKYISNPTTGMLTFYVLCAGSNLYDPHNKGRLRVRSPWKFRRTTRTTFDLYAKFLRTNHRSFLYQAERGI